MNTYQQENPNNFQLLSLLKQRYPNHYIKSLNVFHRSHKTSLQELTTDLIPWIEKCTASKLSRDCYSLHQKIEWILSGRVDFPQCKLCGKPISNQSRFNSTRGYCDTCSKDCAKALKGKRYRETISHIPDFYNKRTKNTIESNLKKYNVKNVFQLKSTKEKIKQTTARNHGDPNFRNVKQARETRLDRYGKWEAPTTNDKRKETFLKHYGKDHNMKCDIGKLEFKNAFKEKYGVQNPGQLDSTKEKVKATCIRRYGESSYMKTQMFASQSKATCLQKYGVDHPSQCPEIQQKMHFKYFYDNKFFDSSPEIAFYIWLKDNNKDFEYQPKVDLWYEFEGKQHNYCPDFIVDGQLVELKGDQFLKEDGTWQNPYDHLKDALYEAKRQCCIANNVKVLYSADYQKYIDYVYQRYGKDFLMKFKRDVNKIDNEIH